MHFAQRLCLGYRTIWRLTAHAFLATVKESDKHTTMGRVRALMAAQESRAGGMRRRRGLRNKGPE
jgi:hypothetical protein